MGKIEIAIKIQDRPHIIWLLFARKM